MDEKRTFEFEHRVADAFSRLNSVMRAVERGEGDGLLNAHEEGNIWVALHTLRRIHRRITVGRFG